MDYSIKRVSTKNGYKTRIKYYENGKTKYSYRKWTAKRNNDYNKNKFLDFKEYKKVDVPDLINEDLVDAYIIESQTSYIDKKKGTRFEYYAKGIFEFEPKPEKSEKMLKSTLLRTFNKGQTNGGKYLKKTVMSDLVNITGLQVTQQKVLRKEITNSFNADLAIKNGTAVWRWSVWKNWVIDEYLQTKISRGGWNKRKLFTTK